MLSELISPGGALLRFPALDEGLWETIGMRRNSSWRNRKASCLVAKE